MQHEQVGVNAVSQSCTAYMYRSLVVKCMSNNATQQHLRQAGLTKGGVSRQKDEEDDTHAPHIHCRRICLHSIYNNNHCNSFACCNFFTVRPLRKAFLWEVVHINSTYSHINHKWQRTVQTQTRGEVALSWRDCPPADLGLSQQLATCTKDCPVTHDIMHDHELQITVHAEGDSPNCHH